MPTIQDYINGAPLPTSVGLRADLYHEVRETRLLMEKETKPVKDLETAIQASIIADLDASDDTGAAGKRYRAQIKIKEASTVTDWPSFHNFILETGRFDLLQKRQAETAVMDMISSGEIPPGVEKINVKTVSITKI